MSHETNRFGRIRHNVLISQNDAIVNEMTYHIPCLVDISIWIKFGGHTFYRKKVIQAHILWRFNQKMWFFKKLSWVSAYDLDLGLDVNSKICSKISNR